MLLMSLLVVTFAAGMFAGIGADRLLAPRLRIRGPADDMSAVLDRLSLTPAQRVQAEAIVARTAPRAQAVMTELAERLRVVADSVDAELRAILTPEQRLRLDALRREPRFMLKRKMATPTGTRVDTLIDSVLPSRVRK
jgi:hypothetical protein